MIRVNANESYYNVLLNFEKELNSIISNFKFNLYPDPNYTELKTSISNYTNIPNENIICTNGSDELIKIIIDTFTNFNDYVLSHSPTFGEYENFSKTRGVNYITTEENLNINIYEIIKMAKKIKPKLIFICNPNNPTGELIEKEKLEMLLSELSYLKDTYIVVDEAYYEFSKTTIVESIFKFKNLIILRTLSKAFSLASIRIGYGISSKNTINKLNKNKMPYNINSISEKIAILALNNSEIFKNYIDETIRRRDKILENLKSISPIKSKANFILIKLNNKEKTLEKLKNSEILVRDFKSNFLKDYIRFSVSTNTINNKIIKIIGEDYEKCEYTKKN